jgi:hypothetical protein
MKENAVSASPGFIDPQGCREDLVKKAARSTFTPDFDWINDKEAIRVTENQANRGLTAIEIRELAREWIGSGGPIKCVAEKREPYNTRRHRHYDIIIQGLAGFPRGLYVEMEISNPDETEPAVNLLNAHPASS